MRPVRGLSQRDRPAAAGRVGQGPQSRPRWTPVDKTPEIPAEAVSGRLGAVLNDV